MTKKRTEQQIVDQTEALADMLMKAFHRREKADPLSTYRGTQDTRARHCWLIACEIQEMLTDTDPENAAAEVDDAPAPLMKAGPVGATPAWEPLTPEVLARLQDEPPRTKYWLAPKARGLMPCPGYTVRTPGEVCFDAGAAGLVYASELSHIQPFITPELPS